MSRQIVIVESPYAGEVVRNKAYLQCAFRDCYARGEIPIASHQLYTDSLIDTVPAERELGIGLGIELRDQLIRAVGAGSVFYVDLGWSSGMRAALESLHQIDGARFEERTIIFSGTWPNWTLVGHIDKVTIRRKVALPGGSL